MAKIQQNTSYINVRKAEEILQKTNKTYTYLSNSVGQSDSYISNCLLYGTISKAVLEALIYKEGVNLSEAVCDEQESVDSVEQRKEARKQLGIARRTPTPYENSATDADRIIEAINHLEATIKELWT